MSALRIQWSTGIDGYTGFLPQDSVTGVFSKWVEEAIPVMQGMETSGVFPLRIDMPDDDPIRILADCLFRGLKQM